jgi:predicted ATP-grasp superfamily ATP-dependent carboligase
MLVLKVSNGLFGMEKIFTTDDKAEMDKMKEIAIKIWGEDDVKVEEFDDVKVI